MKCLNYAGRLIACLSVIFCFAATSQVIQAQTPTSGARLTIVGTVGATPVSLTIYDSQIHSGVVQTPATLGAPCAVNLPTDAYVLQGGSWTGCDPGDAYEVTDSNPSATHQYPGKADLTGTVSGTGYSFHIETHYICAGLCTGISADGPYCNTSGTICANPDSGFLTVTNNSGADFVGTITLQGTPQKPASQDAASFCPVDVHGNAIDTATTSAGTPLANGGSVRLALGFLGTMAAPHPADSSNCGGFNAPQSMTLAQGMKTIFPIGGDDFEITPFLGGTGDSLTVLPIPVPAGPLVAGGFGSEAGLPALTGSRFSATNFPGQASIPIADLSAPGNPVGLEFQVTCAPAPVPAVNDCSNFIYTAQTDFTIDTNSYPGGVGGPHFLGQHEGTPSGYDGACPTNGFSVDIFLSYTGGIGDPPLLGSSDGWSCFVGTFDPTAGAVPAHIKVPQKTLVGFQSPISDTKLNVIKAGSAAPLIWQTFKSDGTPVTNLTLCGSFDGTGCSTTAPWVFIGTAAISCATEQVPNIPETAQSAEGSSSLQNLGGGTYQFNLQTMKGSTGCFTPVLKFSTGFVSFRVANFQFKP